jgi:hypothetical protein
MANLSNINNKFLVTTGGNVLIGATADTGFRLHVTGGPTRVDSYLSLGNNGYIRADTANMLRFQSGTADITFYNSSNSVEHVRIKNNTGNVGIGLISPGAKLDVLQEARVSYANSNQYTLRITNTDGNPRILADGSAAHLIFGTTPSGSTTATERMRIQNDGNVGIGTGSPNKELTLGGAAGTQTLSFTTSAYLGDQAVIGNIEFSTHNADASYAQLANIYALKTGTNTNSGDITFWTKSNGARSEKMRIKNNGVVYIGYVDATAIGSHKLEVNGALYASGNIRTNGIFSNNSAPDDDVFEAIQSGRKCSLKTYFSSGSTESRWVLKTSTGATDGSTVDALTVKPNYAIFNGGITFNGDTAAVNTLDDYEEGGWTPVASDFSGNNATIDTTNSTGVYTKVGDLVYWRCTIQMSSKASMVASDTFQISGFPFTSSSIPGNWYRPSSAIIKQVTFSGFVNFSLVASQSYGYFFDSQSAGAGGTIPVSDIADNCALSVTGVYKSN